MFHRIQTVNQEVHEAFPTIFAIAFCQINQTRKNEFESHTQSICSSRDDTQLKADSQEVHYRETRGKSCMQFKTKMIQVSLWVKENKVTVKNLQVCLTSCQILHHFINGWVITSNLGTYPLSRQETDDETSHHCLPSAFLLSWKVTRVRGPPLREDISSSRTVKGHLDSLNTRLPLQVSKKAYRVSRGNLFERIKETWTASKKRGCVIPSWEQESLPRNYHLFHEEKVFMNRQDKLTFTTKIDRVIYNRLIF